MLRLPPTEIQIDDRDLSWHRRNCERRIKWKQQAAGEPQQKTSPDQDHSNQKSRQPLGNQDQPSLSPPVSESQPRRQNVVSRATDATAVQAVQLANQTLAQMIRDTPPMSLDTATTSGFHHQASHIRASSRSNTRYTPSENASSVEEQEAFGPGTSRKDSSSNLVRAIESSMFAGIHQMDGATDKLGPAVFSMPIEADLQHTLPVASTLQAAAVAQLRSASNAPYLASPLRHFQSLSSSPDRRFASTPETQSQSKVLPPKRQNAEPPRRTQVCWHEELDAYDGRSYVYTHENSINSEAFQQRLASDLPFPIQYIRVIRGPTSGLPIEAYLQRSLTALEGSGESSTRRMTTLPNPLFQGLQNDEQSETEHRRPDRSQQLRSDHTILPNATRQEALSDGGIHSQSCQSPGTRSNTPAPTITTGPDSASRVISGLSRISLTLNASSDPTDRKRRIESWRSSGSIHGAKPIESAELIQNEADQHAVISTSDRVSRSKDLSDDTADDPCVSRGNHLNTHSNERVRESTETSASGNGSCKSLRRSLAPNHAKALRESLDQIIDNERCHRAVSVSGPGSNEALEDGRSSRESKLAPDLHRTSSRGQSIGWQHRKSEIERMNRSAPDLTETRHAPDVAASGTRRREFRRNGELLSNVSQSNDRVSIVHLHARQPSPRVDMAIASRIPNFGPTRTISTTSAISSQSRDSSPALVEGRRRAFRRDPSEESTGSPPPRPPTRERSSSPAEPDQLMLPRVRRTALSQHPYLSPTPRIEDLVEPRAVLRTFQRAPLVPPPFRLYEEPMAGPRLMRAVPPVYNDRGSPYMQPQTPHGLPRHGMPVAASHSAPLQRARRWVDHGNRRIYFTPPSAFLGAVVPTSMPTTTVEIGSDPEGTRVSYTRRIEQRPGLGQENAGQVGRRWQWVADGR